MSVPTLVDSFYSRIWKDGELQAISELLTADFTFRGSLGTELHGRGPFRDYVLTVRQALADYRCEILECVAEGAQAFAKMRFSGIHVAEFRNFPATGKPVCWLGAALFRFRQDAISELWVLGDLTELDSILKSNQAQLHEFDLVLSG